MTAGALAADAWWSLLEHHPSVMLLIDPVAASIVDGNLAAVDYYGHDRARLRGSPVSLINPMPTDELQARLTTARDSGGKHYHVRHVLANGEEREVSVLAGPVRIDDETFMCAIVHDETERNESLRDLERFRAKLDASHRRFEALVERTTDPLMVFTDEGEISYRTPAAAAFLGETGPLRGEDVTNRIEPRDLERVRGIWQTMDTDRGGTRRTALQIRRADGRTRHLDVTLTDLRHLPAVGGVVVTAKDLTDELAVRARLEHQATHDGLTGLANRSLLFERLRALLGPGILSRPDGDVDDAAEAPDPSTDAPAAALAMLDLAGMSGINDRVGHQTGDLLLRGVAQRLERLVGDDGLVARTSGDEFAVLLPGIDDNASARSATLRLATAFDDPFATPGGGTVALRARFGVAVSNGASSTLSGLLQDAALALRAARASGAGPVRVCDDELREAEQRRLSIEHGLTHPSVTDQLWPVYQPIVGLADGRVHALEALLRWEHPQLGRVGPDEFIPLAERNGTIMTIGAWVLRTACEQLAAWDSAGGDPTLAMSVNLSARQLLDPDLASTVSEVLTETRITPDRLWLEVTETAIADENDVTGATVDALAALGTRLHIDDFGTGYSSLAQLRRFPFHGLKIDRSFVTPLGEDEEAEAVVSALLAIAAASDLHVVAEGVETDAQLACLCRLRCPMAQGYRWSQPVPADEVPTLLTAMAPDRAS